MEEFLRNIQALELVHGLDLLLTFGSSVVQGLILLLDQVDFTLDLLLPLLVVVLLTLLVLLLELADLLELCLFLDFEDGLFDRLVQQDVKDGLNFTIIFK